MAGLPVATSLPKMQMICSMTAAFHCLHSFFSGVANPPFTVAEPPGDGLPSVHFAWPNTPVAQFWVAGEVEIPMDTIAANALATLSKYNRPVTAAVTDSVPLTKADLRRLDKWWVNFTAC
jgi:hypothetical protein